MKLCERCFRVPTWPANAESAYSAGECSFGHGYSQTTWNSSAWEGAFRQLLALYQPVTPGGESGADLPVLIQLDWNIFDLSAESIALLLDDAVPGHELFSANHGVRLRSDLYESDGDELGSWNEFAIEIRHGFRYFPRVLPNSDLLTSAFLDRSVAIDVHTELFRARLTSGDEVFSADAMNAPPVSSVRPGRANPSGIRYLYLAMAKETSVYEVRPGQFTNVCLATFRPIRELSVLDLKDIERPDFFDDGPGSRLLFFRYLRGLSDELSRPVRSSDDPVEYVPTQYLCEFARHLGMDGVVYGSSVSKSGTNVVIFDPDLLRCDPHVEMVSIEEISLRWIPK